MDRYLIKLRILEIGRNVGYRLHELGLWREKSSKRETQLLNVLFYVTNNFWKSMCGRIADSLERSTENENECNLHNPSSSSKLNVRIDMIFDNDPLICKFISPPKELQSLNCAVFYSGMIESILISSGFVSIFLE